MIDAQPDARIELFFVVIIEVVEIVIIVVIMIADKSRSVVGGNL